MQAHKGTPKCIIMTQTQTFDYNNYRSIKILRHCIWTRSINVSVVLRRVPRQTMSRCVPLRRPRPVWLLLYVKLLRYLGTTFFETFYFWTLDPLHFRWMNAPIFVSRNAVVLGGGGFQESAECHGFLEVSCLFIVLGTFRWQRHLVDQHGG